MADSADSNSKVPQAETLKPRADNGTVINDAAAKKADHHPLSDKEKHHRAYRPSHKATFIGVAVVILILGINAAVLGFLLKKNSSQSKALAAKGVSISPGVLSKLGVNDAQIGNASEQLTVDPKAQFNSQVTVAGDLNVSGQLHLNSTFTANNASLSQLQAGNTSVSALNVNGNTTASNLGLRGSMTVTGPATFQNTVTVSQLLSAANGAAISGNVSVGGTLTANTIAAHNLELTGSFIFGSHIQTSGGSPTFGPGPALAAYGTASISGDDAAGTIDVNLGAGGSSPGGGILVYVSFRSQYSSTPRIVATPVGYGASIYVTDITTSGFAIGITGSSQGGVNFPAGGYQIDYLVQQ